MKSSLTNKVTLKLMSKAQTIVLVVWPQESWLRREIIVMFGKNTLLLLLLLLFGGPWVDKMFDVDVGFLPCK